MSNDYKLCPNCNNALDLNVSKCPYCGQQVFGLDLSKGADGLVKIVGDIEKTANKKQTSGCAKVIIFFVVIQVIGAVLSIIFQILSGL